MEPRTLKRYLGEPGASRMEDVPSNQRFENNEMPHDPILQPWGEPSKQEFHFHSEGPLNLVDGLLAFKLPEKSDQMSKSRCQYGVNDEVPNGIRSREIVGIHKLLVFLRTSSNPYLLKQLQMLHTSGRNPTCRHLLCIHFILYIYPILVWMCVYMPFCTQVWKLIRQEVTSWPYQGVFFWNRKALRWFGYLSLRFILYNIGMIYA